MTHTHSRLVWIWQLFQRGPCRPPPMDQMPNKQLHIMNPNSFDIQTNYLISKNTLHYGIILGFVFNASPFPPACILHSALSASNGIVIIHCEKEKKLWEGRFLHSPSFFVSMDISGQYNLVLSASRVLSTPRCPTSSLLWHSKRAFSTFFIPNHLYKPSTLTRK